MKYSGTIKSMMLYGFVPQTDIKSKYWTGTGSQIIIPAANASV